MKMSFTILGKKSSNVLNQWFNQLTLDFHTSWQKLLIFWPRIMVLVVSEPKTGLRMWRNINLPILLSSLPFFTLVFFLVHRFRSGNLTTSGLFSKFIPDKRAPIFFGDLFYLNRYKGKLYIKMIWHPHHQRKHTV